MKEYEKNADFSLIQYLIRTNDIFIRSMNSLFLSGIISMNHCLL